MRISKNTTMFLRTLGKSFKEQKARMTIALLAVIVGASATSALISVSYDIGQKVGSELRAYGANLLLVPKVEKLQVASGIMSLGEAWEEKYIDESDLQTLSMIDPAEKLIGYAPYLYDVVEVNSQKVVLVGTWFDEVKNINPWWQVKGNWVENRTDASSSIVGITVAEKLNLGLGSSFTVKYGEKPDGASQTLNVVGIVRTGSSEDNQIFVNLHVAQSLVRRPKIVSLVFVSVSGDGKKVEAVAKEIEENIPSIEAKPIRQIAQSEGIILGKIKLMILLVTLVILLTSGLCVFTTMTDVVLARRKEIGLMKAIGAESKRIAALFLSEAGVIGLLGGLIGYGIGMALAQFIGKSVFQAGISPRLIVVFMVVFLSVGIALLASLLPVKRAAQTQPARVLRGE